MPDKPHFPTEEEKVLAYWEEIDAFHKQLELSEGKPEFTFYDGPPFATGKPHYGHIAAGTIKVSIYLSKVLWAGFRAGFLLIGIIGLQRVYIIKMFSDLYYLIRMW